MGKSQSKFFLLFPIQAFFVGMLVLPTSFQLIRGVILIVITSVALVVAFTKWRIKLDAFLLWVITMVVGAFGMTLGLCNGAPGALRVGTVYLLWPTLYLLFIGLAHNLRVIRKLEAALLLGVCVTTAMSLVVMLSGLLGLGDFVFPLLSFQDAGFGSYDGYIEFRLFNLTTVMYGFPFVVSFLLTRRNELYSWRRLGVWVLLVAMLVVACGSGRRMFWLLVLITPVLVLFFLQLSSLRLRAVDLIGFGIWAAMIGTIGLGAMIYVFELQPPALFNEFASIFSSQEEGNHIRYEQAYALWSAFESSPFWGIGLGSTVNSAYRQGWAFELWGLSLLKSVGIGGVLVYAGAVSWIFIKGTALSWRNREFAALFVPLSAALSGFLIMTMTNPYLGKFDYLWTIFLPVAAINAYRTQKQ